MRRRVALDAKPNPGHIALAELECALGERLFLCTQNVDNLHEQAGSRRVVHMHGELFKSRCDNCPRPPFDDANTYEPPADIPRCSCGGRIRPHVCWFGEVPYHVDEIFQAIDACTVFVAVGTSGVVEPAASFVGHVRAPDRSGRGRARTIYVGPGRAGEPRGVHGMLSWQSGRNSSGSFSLRMKTPRPCESLGESDPTEQVGVARIGAQIFPFPIHF